MNQQRMMYLEHQRNSENATVLQRRGVDAQDVRHMTLRYERPLCTDQIGICSDHCDLRWQRANIIHAEVVSS